MLKSNSKLFLYIIFLIYLVGGVTTQCFLIGEKNIDDFLLEDWIIYEDAVKNAKEGNDIYFEKRIGIAFLYSPPEAVKCSEKYDWNKVAKRYLKKYEELCK